MKTKGTWVFLGLVSFLVVLTIWDLQREKKEAQIKEEQSVFIPYKEDHIQNLLIQTKDTKIELDKTVDGWKVISPYQDWADNSVVLEFISTLVGQKSQKTVAAAEQIDLNIYGLLPPLLTIKVTHQNQENIAWELGSKKSYEGNSYLKKQGGQDVLLANTDWSQWILKRPFEFRDKRLLRGRIGSVTSIKIKTSAGLMAFEKKDNKWVSTKFPDLNLDQNRVHEFLTQLSQSQALDFLIENKISKEDRAKYKLTSPQVVIELLIGEKKWTLEMSGGDQQASFAAVSEPVFLMKVASADYDKFKNLKISDFRDKKEPFAFNKDVVKKVEMATNLKKQTFELRGSDWVLSDGETGLEVNQDVMSSLLEKIKNTRAVDYSKTRPVKWDQRILLKDQSGQLIYELAWRDIEKSGADKDALVLAQSSLTKDLFYIKKSDIEKFNFEQIIKEGPKDEEKADKN